MPTYQVPDIVEVPLNDLELPFDVPVDGELTVKPLAACNKLEVEAAVQAFTQLVRDSQTEIEASIKKHIEFRRRVAHLEAYRKHFDDIGWVREQSN
jgi:hypothetical protein